MTNPIHVCSRLDSAFAHIQDQMHKAKKMNRPIKMATLALMEISDNISLKISNIQPRDSYEKNITIFCVGV